MSSSNFHARRAATFNTTQWSVVATAAGAGDAAGDALQQLCERYWPPLFAYVRRRGYGTADAQDLTQAFFVRLIEKNVVQSADRQRGSFRSFLLASMNHFLSNERDRANAQKRGGGGVPFSINGDDAQSQIDLAAHSTRTPQEAFEHQWGLTLLRVVHQRLAQEYEKTNREKQFSLLKHTLTGLGGSQDYSDVAAQMGVSIEAARQAAYRLRRRYREHLHNEIASTLGPSGDVEEELKRLFVALKK